MFALRQTKVGLAEIFSLSTRLQKYIKSLYVASKR